VTAHESDVIVRSSGGAHTSSDEDSDIDELADTGEAADVEIVPEPDEAEVADDSAAPATTEDDQTPVLVTSTPSHGAMQGDSDHDGTTAVPVVSHTSHDSGDHQHPVTSANTDPTATTIEEPEFDVQPLTLASALRATSTSVVEPVQQPAVQAPTLITLAAQLLNFVLTPIFDQMPDAPSPESPLLWTVLGWVRRQLDELLPKSTVVPGPVQLAAEVDPGVHPPAEDPGGEHTGLPEELERTTLVSGLDQPTDFRFLPDGRILISEKGGAIKVYDDGHVHDEPLITLVVLPTDTDEERGLLGIEVDPNFEDNGYLYVSYTTAANRDRLSRLTVTGDIADPDSELVLMESDQPGNIYHHGGEIHFGPDGKLYWAMGMNTYNPNSQNLSNVHGKILRLNPDGSVPEDNPFVDTPGALPEIWAYGLRNPFRFAFTPNGKLLAGDVGGDAFEELNIVTAGANYGWPLAEGVCEGCSYANPIYTYPHTAPPAKAGSITAVMVYTGSTFPDEYQNKVFIADYTLGWIKELTFDSDYTSFISEKMFDDSAGTTVKLAQGPDGNIYQLTIFPGVLSLIAPSGGNRAPSAAITASPASGLAPLEIDFSSAGSHDPDPDTTLTYAWDFGDGGTSTDPNPTRTYTVNGGYNVTLTVSDGEKTGQATKRIVVGSTAPSVEILSPVHNSQYAAGDVISFSGLGTDDEDGVLADSAYEWTVEFHHADHVHPFRDNIVGPTGSVVIPRSADNIDTTWYRITLTVTDSSGLSSSRSVDVKPQLVTLTFNASDPDATYTIDGIPRRGSYTEQAVVGVERVLGAVSPQYVDGGQLVFDNWSDGLAASHSVITPGASTTYTINYDRFLTPPAPWHEGDIGRPSVPGYASYDDGVFTVRGAGGDIWGPTDEFHYVYQSFSGDGTVIARVTAQTDTDDWAKSGIMIKESATPGAKYVLLAVTPDNGVTFQYDFDGDGGSAPYTLPNAWLKLEREGDVFRGYTSADGATWTLVGQTTLELSENVTAGLEVMSHDFDTLNTTTFDNVSVVSGQQWQSQDVGAPVLAGATTISGGTHVLTGAGDDVWGTSDQFHFSYQSLPADGEIVARVTSFTGTVDGWAKAGVMIKQSATAGSPYALLALTPENGSNLQYGFDHNIAGPAIAPGTSWVKLTRTGDTITGFVSIDGTVWTEVGSATVDLEGAALIGLFVTSHDGSMLSTATFDHVSVTDSVVAPGLPSPWTGADVGAPRLAGSASYAGGTFTINGAGDDIWGEADQSHFVHQSLSGDGEIVVRVTDQESGTDGWAKAGVMVKQSSAAGASYALLAVTPEHGATLQYDFDNDAGSVPYTPGQAWLKLQRSGDTVTGYVSSDGQVWTEVGSATVGFEDDVLIGMFVTSHNGSQLNTSVFDNVTVTAHDDAALSV